MSDRFGLVRVIERVATFTGSSTPDYMDRCLVTISGDERAVRDSVRKLNLNIDAIQVRENVLSELTMGEALYQIGDYLKNGERINAIKRVRELSGLGIKESKDIIDAFTGYLPRVETFNVR